NQELTGKLSRVKVRHVARLCTKCACSPAPPDHRLLLPGDRHNLRLRRLRRQVLGRLLHGLQTAVNVVVNVFWAHPDGPHISEELCAQFWITLSEHECRIRNGGVQGLSEWPNLEYSQSGRSRPRRRHFRFRGQWMDQRRGRCRFSRACARGG